MLKSLGVVLFGGLLALQSVKAFTCTVPGLFPDLNSADCTHYNICVDNNGQLEWTLAVCAQDFVFHWQVLGCVPRSMFDCPNLHTTTTVMPTTITPPPGAFLCPGSGNFPDETSLDCRNFLSCPGPGLPPTSQTCPGQATFNWQEGRCMFNNNAQCPADVPPFTCDGVGDFPDPYSEDCSFFFQCFVNWDGTIRHTRVECPLNMAFDWVMLTCRVRAVSECLAGSQPSTTPSTTTTTTTTAKTTTTTAPQPSGFICPGFGQFPDETSLDCSRFYNCPRANVPGIPNTCGALTHFSWTLGRCAIASLEECPAAAPPFNCPGNGDFPNPDALDCTTFFRCFRHWDGTTRHTLVNCPGNQQFDWIFMECRVRIAANCLA